jgi:hypothetical protein
MALDDPVGLGIGVEEFLQTRRHAVVLDRIGGKRR